MGEDAESKKDLDSTGQLFRIPVVKPIFIAKLSTLLLQLATPFLNSVIAIRAVLRTSVSSITTVRKLKPIHSMDLDTYARYASPRLIIGSGDRFSTIGKGSGPGAATGAGLRLMMSCPP